jgi:hypothetical protein
MNALLLPPGSFITLDFLKSVKPVQLCTLMKCIAEIAPREEKRDLNLGIGFINISFVGISQTTFDSAGHLSDFLEFVAETSPWPCHN